MRLKGKIALVTGSSRGIGRAAGKAVVIGAVGQRSEMRIDFHMGASINPGKNESKVIISVQKDWRRFC